MNEFEFHPHIQKLLRAAAENSSPPMASLTAEEVRASRNQILASLAGSPDAYNFDLSRKKLQKKRWESIIIYSLLSSLCLG